MKIVLWKIHPSFFAASKEKKTAIIIQKTTYFLLGVLPVWMLVSVLPDIVRQRQWGLLAFEVVLTAIMVVILAANILTPKKYNRMFYNLTEKTDPNPTEPW